MLAHVRPHDVLTQAQTSPQTVSRAARSDKSHSRTAPAARCGARRRRRRPRVSSSVVPPSSISPKEGKPPPSSSSLSLSSIAADESAPSAAQPLHSLLVCRERRLTEAGERGEARILGGARRLLRRNPLAFLVATIDQRLLLPRSTTLARRRGAAARAADRRRPPRLTLTLARRRCACACVHRALDGGRRGRRRRRRRSPRCPPSRRAACGTRRAPTPSSGELGGWLSSARPGCAWSGMTPMTRRMRPNGLHCVAGAARAAAR